MKSILWRRIVYRIVNTGVYVLALLIFRLKVTGRERFPPKGGVLVACNHVSYLDPPLVHSSVPRSVVHSMAKKRLFRHPFLNWFMTTVETICVDPARFRDTLSQAVSILKEGKCVVIFPEGTRSDDGLLKKGRWGAVSIAITSGCAIVPTAIIGSEKAFPRGEKTISFTPIEIHFGDPYTILSESVHTKGSVSREILVRETERLMKKIEELFPEKMRPCPQVKKDWYRD